MWKRIKKKKNKTKIKTSPSTVMPLNRKGRAEKRDAEMVGGRGERWVASDFLHLLFLESIPSQLPCGPRMWELYHNEIIDTAIYWVLITREFSKGGDRTFQTPGWPSRVSSQRLEDRPVLLRASAFPSLLTSTCSQTRYPPKSAKPFLSGVVPHSYNSGTWETEAGGLRVRAQTR